MEDRLRTIAQEQAYLKMMMALDDLKVDVADSRLRQALIPADWDKLERVAPTRPRRKKVTVALDADVAKWFHDLGEGYHRRINAVLRTYMFALISKEVLGQGDRDRRGNEIWGKAAPKKKED
ncbi:BrnA antitoxin family protein [Amaricoccus sp.]|uniref:BrnA antitoxin family protein n=1 Tax=Amaricoccus sp. TaxID=1872485 RepID=UPI001B67CCDF|nr:BrnA antitoxin family protein [Amaricoccus sp.]MBP7002350.1 BrnA antitoxin family protein [Amaricoccus sp.]